jgi:hypothetical protein
MISQSYKLALFAALGFIVAMLLFRQPQKSQTQAVRISDSRDQAQTTAPVIVSSDSGQPLYMQRPAGTDLQLVAAGHSTGGPP